MTNQQELQALLAKLRAENVFVDADDLEVILNETSELFMARAERLEETEPEATNSIRADKRIAHELYSLSTDASDLYFDDAKQSWEVA